VKKANINMTSDKAYFEKTGAGAARALNFWYGEI
jgi:hypothetical protein